VYKQKNIFPDLVPPIMQYIDFVAN